MSDLSWRVLVRQEVFPMAKLGDVLRQLAREVDQAEQALATVTAERDEARAERDAAVDRLVGARVARESAIEDAEALRAQLAKTERVVDAARIVFGTSAEHGPFDLEDARLIEAEAAFARALRALDSPAGAGTDSGGASGAAVGNAAPPVPNMPAQAGEQPGGGDTTLGDTHPPEPAGSSCRCGAGCKPVPRYAGDDDSPVGVAATAEDGHEAPARNRQPAEPPSDPATGTTRREPPEPAIGGSTGAVACPVCRCLKVGHHPGGCEGAGGNCGCTERFPEGRGRAVEKPDPQAPATRAEVEELRWRVDRLETLTGFVPKE